MLCVCACVCVCRNVWVWVCDCVSIAVLYYSCMFGWRVPQIYFHTGWSVLQRMLWRVLGLWRRRNMTMTDVTNFFWVYSIFTDDNKFICIHVVYCKFFCSFKIKYWQLLLKSDFLHENEFYSTTILRWLQIIYSCKESIISMISTIVFYWHNYYSHSLTECIRECPFPCGVNDWRFQFIQCCSIQLSILWNPP